MTTYLGAARIRQLDYLRPNSKTTNRTRANFGAENFFDIFLSSEIIARDSRSRRFALRILLESLQAREVHDESIMQLLEGSCKFSLAYQKRKCLLCVIVIGNWKRESEGGSPMISQRRVGNNFAAEIEPDDVWSH